MGIEANYYSSFQKNVAHILVGSGTMTEGLSSHSTEFKIQRTFRDKHHSTACQHYSDLTLWP